MNFGKTKALRPSSIASRTNRAGFTFAEVLAAMVFMAIVIPVAIQGLRIASRAGVAAERKSVAVQLAESVMNELIVTGQWASSGQSGSFEPQWPGYRWTARTQPWQQDPVRLFSVEVTYPVQDQTCAVRLSTLVSDLNP